MGVLSANVAFFSLNPIILDRFRRRSSERGGEGNLCLFYNFLPTPPSAAVNKRVRRGEVGSPERRGISASRLGCLSSPVLSLSSHFSSFPSSLSPNPWILPHLVQTKKKVSPGVGARVLVNVLHRTHGCNLSAHVP